jgi:membrane protein CcdC involved in cytochrome C biogenesis
MFLLPFTVISENILIRFIAGSLQGIFLIMLLSFAVKVQSVFEKDKEH